MKSWRTTVCGVISAVGVILFNATAVLDNDPNTVLDLEKVVESGTLVALAFGLLAARDNKVTSEAAGLK